MLPRARSAPRTTPRGRRRRGPRAAESGGTALPRRRHETLTVALRVAACGLGRDGHSARVTETELVLRFGGPRYDDVVVGYVFWSAWSIAERFASRFGPVVAMISGPYFSEELFGSVALTLA